MRAPHPRLDWSAQGDCLKDGERTVAKPNGQPAQETNHLGVLTPDDSGYSRQSAGGKSSLLLSVVLYQSVPVLKEQGPFPTTRKYSVTVRHPECVLVRFCLWQKKTPGKPTKVDILILQILYHKLALLVKDGKLVTGQPGGVSANRSLNSRLHIGSSL